METIYFLHNIISPYRIPLFEKLNKLFNIHVYFYKETFVDRKWKVDHNYNFKYHILKGFTIELGSIISSFNPELFTIIIKHRPNIIIISDNTDVTSVMALIIAKIMRIKTILYSESNAESQSLLRIPIIPLYKMFAKYVDSIVVPGIQCKNYFLSLGANPSKIFIAPDAIDNDQLITFQNKYSEEITVFKFQKEKIHLLYVGQLIERKGVEVLIRAFNDVQKNRNDIILNIVGDGPNKNNLMSIVDSNKIQGVIFHGWVDDFKKNFLYSTSNIFILPTLSDSWGLVVNEAMCFGLPVICTEAAGCSNDLVLDGITGIIIPKNNILILANAIRDLLDDPEKAIRMGHAGQMRVQENYSIDNEVDGFTRAIIFLQSEDKIVLPSSL